MPFTRNPVVCWVLLVPDWAAGELCDYHAPAGDCDAYRRLADLRWDMFAADPWRNPPVPELQARPCLVVQCRVCGLRVGDGEHFENAEYAWEAAECDGWQGDLCPSCQVHNPTSHDPTVLQSP